MQSKPGRIHKHPLGMTKSSLKRPGFECQICFVVSATQVDYVNHILQVHSAPATDSHEEQEDDEDIHQEDDGTQQEEEEEEVQEVIQEVVQEEEVFIEEEDEGAEVTVAPEAFNEVLLPKEQEVATEEVVSNQKDPELPQRIEDSFKRRSTSNINECDRCNKLFITRSHLR